MPDLIDEVDEELRAERAKKIAQRYGGLATGALLLAIAGVGGWEGWRWYEGRQAGQASQSFLAAWEALSRDNEADPLYRDLATVLWGLHALDQGDPALIEARMGPLAVPGAPWRASAQEVLALAALKRGNTEQARRALQAVLADAAAPQGLRERAGRMLQGLGS